jgi:hypothetical protein
MNTAKIPNSVGFSATDGQVNGVSMIDQLKRIVNMQNVTSFKHPVHGMLEVTKERAKELLTPNVQEGHLYRFKKSMFV